MKEVDLNFFAKGLDGVETTSHVGKGLALSITSQPKGDAMKLFQWAVTLYRHEKLILNIAEIEILKKFVAECDSIYVLAKAQILEAIYSAKDHEGQN